MLKKASCNYHTKREGKSNKSWTVPQVTNGGGVQVVCGISKKTGVLYLRGAKTSTSKKKETFINLKNEEKKKALRNAVSGIQARSAVRRGKRLQVGVESEKMEASQQIDICK